MNTLPDEKFIQMHNSFFSYLQTVISGGTREKKIYIETKMVAHIYIQMIKQLTKHAVDFMMESRL